MSLIRSRYAVSRCWGLLGVLFSALLVLALFHPSVATAQEVKQIKLTEKHIQGFMAASKDMARLYDGADPGKPDPKVDAQAATVAKKNGFASLAEYEGASMNISMIMFGIDPQTKKFTSPSIRSRSRSRRSKSTNPYRRRKRKRSWRNWRLRSRTQSPFNSRKTSR